MKTDKIFSFDYIFERFLIGVFLLFLLSLCLGGTSSAYLVSYIEIRNNTLFIEKPFYTENLPQLQKIPYYKIIANEYTGFSNDLSFFVPISGDKMKIKIISLINESVIYEGNISFCNDNGICESYEIDSCVDCNIKSLKQVENELKSDYEVIKQNFKKFQIKKYNPFPVILLLLMMFIFVIILIYMRRTKRSQISTEVMIIAAMGVVVTAVLSSIFVSQTHTVSTKVQKVYDKATLIQICTQLEQEYKTNENVYFILFQGTQNVECVLEYKDKSFSCNGLCKDVLFFERRHFSNLDNNEIQNGITNVKITIG